MQTEIQSLQNFGDTLGLKIHQKFVQDRRATIKKYYATLNGSSVSPVLDFEQLNCFMIGWLNRETKGKFTSKTLHND